MALDIGLPVQELRSQITACLSGASQHEELVLDAVNRKGKPIACRVTCVTLRSDSSDESAGVILLMEALRERPT